MARHAPPQQRAPIQCMPTAAELQRGRAGLRRADHGVTRHDLSGIRVRRTVGENAADYYDRMLDIRRGIHRLGQGVGGNRMLTEINARTAALNPGAPGTAYAPATAVDIGHGAAMTARPRVDSTLPVPAMLAQARLAYRLDGAAGGGQASHIGYNHQALSANRHISLGHELVHAWRNAHGRAVGDTRTAVPAIRDTPLLDQRLSPRTTVRTLADTHALEKEEHETVGLAPTPGVAWAPSENMVRAEQGRPARLDYSGTVPGHLDGAVANIDQSMDDRSFFDRMRGVAAPRPLHDLLERLEG